MSSLRPVTRVLRTIQRPAFMQTTVRPYSSSNDTVGPNKTHTTDKPPHDIQSDASNKAQKDRASSEGNSSATQESDSHNSNKRAEQETKAPKGTVIGMNDERGGKGM